MANQEIVQALDSDPRYAEIKAAQESGRIDLNQAIALSRVLYSVLNDYRFHEIRDSLVAREISTSDAIVAAQERIKAFQAYHQILEKSENENRSPTLSENLSLLGLSLDNKNTPSSPPATFPLFSDLLPFFQGDFQKMPALLVNPDKLGKQLSDDQVGRLFEIEHARYAIFDMIQSWYGTHPDLSGLSDPNQKRIHDFFNKDPFVNSILKMKTEGKLSADRAAYWIMAEADAELKIKQLLVVGARLKAVKNGKYLDQPLDLGEIQADLLARAQSEH